MLIVEISAEPNGAHASQTTSAPITPIDGWIVVPTALEAATLPLLPWVKLTVKNGVVTAVEDDAEARAAWLASLPPEPEPQPTAEERISQLEAIVYALLGEGDPV